MAEKLGEGHRNSDRRKSGVARRVAHTVSSDANNQVGDRRRNTYGPRVDKPSSSRTVPIAETVGGDLKRPQNGGGSRAVPKAIKAMKVGEW